MGCRTGRAGWGIPWGRGGGTPEAGGAAAGGDGGERKELPEAEFQGKLLLKTEQKTKRQYRSLGGKH